MLREIAQSIVLIGFSASCIAGGHGQSSFAQESFTEDDFAQFFSLVEDGKIAAADMSERCREQGIGFTFVGRDISHDGERQRIFYNVSREDSSADGRTLRAKHFNASFGEWTGSVFKPLCPGMYTIAVDFPPLSDAEVAIYLWKPGEERPGSRILGSATGHLTLALPLRSMEEISTWSESAKSRTLEQVSFTAVKVQHLENYVVDVDMDRYTEDIALLKRTARD